MHKNHIYSILLYKSIELKLADWFLNFSYTTVHHYKRRINEVNIFTFTVSILDFKNKIAKVIVAQNYSFCTDRTEIKSEYFLSWVQLENGRSNVSSLTCLIVETIKLTYTIILGFTHGDVGTQNIKTHRTWLAEVIIQ